MPLTVCCSIWSFAAIGLQTQRPMRSIKRKATSQSASYRCSIDAWTHGETQVLASFTLHTMQSTVCPLHAFCRQPIQEQVAQGRGQWQGRQTSDCRLQQMHSLHACSSRLPDCNRCTACMPAAYQESIKEDLSREVAIGCPSGKCGCILQSFAEAWSALHRSLGGCPSSALCRSCSRASWMRITQ